MKEVVGREIIMCCMKKKAVSFQQVEGRKIKTNKDNVLNLNACLDLKRSAECYTLVNPGESILINISS